MISFAGTMFLVIMGIALLAIQTYRLHVEASKRVDLEIQLDNVKTDNNAIARNAKLEVEDIKARYEEIRKVPHIAYMTDNQVQVLAEILAVHVREILNSPKELVN